MSDSINKLQTWYMMNCNGDWEHSYGLKIETLDNPGWSLKIELNDTALDNLEISTVNIQNSEDDWYTCKIENNQFVAFSDATKLGFIIDYFLDEVVAKHARLEVSYEIYESIAVNDIFFYRPLLAKLQADNIFIIEDTPQIDYSKLKAVNLDDLLSVNTEEILQAKSRYKIGDEVKCALIKMFDYPCVVIID